MRKKMRNIFGRLTPFFSLLKEQSGKASIVVIVSTLFFFGLAIFFNFTDPSTRLPFMVSADTATTTVTVLNTPPLWAVDAQEEFESSTSTPTNAGSNVSFIGTATDPNAESFYLLICKTSSTPTANASAAPTCAGGGSNLWAVSTSTNSGSQARAAYTTIAGNPEANEWFAWVCDGNAGTPQCNTTYKQGTGTSTSPFVVNHRPNFTIFTDDSPTLPGAVVTWTANASDTDAYGGQDLVSLFVCRAADFTGTACGAGGTFCSSSAVSGSPNCSSTLSSPLQDNGYNAFGYVIDNHNFAASGGAHGSDSVLTVANAAPTVSSSSISLNDTDDVGALTLTMPEAQTTGFSVTLTVTDNNSCQNSSGGREINSLLLNVYRSGIGQSNCQTLGNYNPNNCYAGALPTSSWSVSCSQVTSTCSGSSDATADWRCTFPLWHLADPTDGSGASDSQYFGENWLASVQAIDDNSATSSLTQCSTGNEVQSFLAYRLNTATIAYGSLQPGSSTPLLSASTTIAATGNVGLDQTLYGGDMCTQFPACVAGSTTSTIPVTQHRFATSTVGYASSSASVLQANPGSELELNVFKSIATSTAATGTTFWGIAIPSTITLAGDYTGQNTFIGVKGEAQNWQ